VLNACAACARRRELVGGSGPFANDERCRDFVENLVRLRAKFGWTQEQLASECLVSKAVISNIESFQRAPLVEQGEQIDKAFGLSGMFGVKARAIQGGAFSDAFESFPEQEATADDLYVYEHSVFPGLLQIERYARATFEPLPNITADEIDRKVSGRMSRQEILFREDGRRPRLWALIDEAALHRPVAPADVMYEQCMHVLEVSRLPNVSLAVVPYSAGGHIGLSGACTIVERDGYPRIVNLDDLADGRVSEDPIIVRRVALRFRSLQLEALPSGTSRDMIARFAEETWKRTARDGARVLTAPATAGSA
jgi:transcriptional regulator with XRE-family HTH domain